MPESFYSTSMVGHLSDLSAFFGLGATLTIFLCFFAPSIGVALGVMDRPTLGVGHKRHAQPTPAVGGLIAATVTSAIFLVSSPIRGQFVQSIPLLFVLATMLIGFLDDRKPIPATTRLILGTIIATLLLLTLPELQVKRLAFPSVDLVIDTGHVAIPFTMLCLLVLKNSINMADGRNGLLLGLAIIWTTFFIFHALPSMLPMLFGILACFLVLFAFNVQGKLFMGDCGSYGLATFFGILALSLHENAFGTVHTAEVVLLFLVPVADTGRLIIVRIAQGQTPFAPDGQHLHHLLDRAVGWKRGWFVYMALVASPLAVYQLLAENGVSLILAAAGAYVLLVWLCSGSGVGSSQGRSQQRISS